jgi:O-antigen/teichoic acid export membrane protein
MTSDAVPTSGLVRAFSATFATRLIGAGLGIISAVLMARALGPDGRGIFAAATTLAAVAIQFGNLGIHSANSYFIARDKTLVEAIIVNSLWLGTIWGILVAFLTYLASRWLGTLDKIGSSAAIIALSSVPVGILLLLLTNLLIPLGAVRRYNEIDLGQKLLWLIALLPLLVWQIVEPYWFIAAVALSQAVVLLLATASLPRPKTFAFSRDLLHKQLPYGFRAYLATVFAFLVLRIDILMVQQMAGSAEAGHYSIAVAMADFLYILPAALAALTFPRMAAATSETARRAFTIKMSVAIAGTMCVCGLMAALVARPVITMLFGAPFAPAAEMFHVLAVAIAAYGVNNILSGHMAARGMPWAAVWVWLGAVIITIVLNLILIPHYGGLGAAWASVAAYSFVLIVQSIMFVTEGRTPT